MDSNRYNTWIAVWENFLRIERTKEVRELYELLNRLWLEERKEATPEALAAHAGAASRMKQ